MNFKPGDLFFTVVEFFSIVVPGTMLLGLAWDRSKLVAIFPIIQSGIADAFTFLVVAYLLGYAINASASWLDKLYDKSGYPKKKREKNAQLAGNVRQIIVSKLGVEVNETESILTWPEAFLRSAKNMDISHIEHLEAESKFFRSIIIVLLVYFVFFLFKTQVLLAFVSVLILPLALWRYMDRRVARTMETYRAFIAGEAMGTIARRKDK